MAPCPLVDLYAIDEIAGVAEQRRGVTAMPPAGEPHFVGFDEGRVLTVEAVGDKVDVLTFKGAAVTELD